MSVPPDVVQPLGLEVCGSHPASQIHSTTLLLTKTINTKDRACVYQTKMKCIFQNSSLFVGLTAGTVDILSILNADEEIAFSENKLNHNGKIIVDNNSV